MWLCQFILSASHVFLTGYTYCTHYLPHHIPVCYMIYSNNEKTVYTLLLKTWLKKLLLSNQLSHLDDPNEQTSPADEDHESCENLVSLELRWFHTL